MSSAASDAPYEVLATCPACLVEGGAIELMDPLHPSSFFATPSERRCRVCGLLERCEPAAVTHRLPDACPSCAEPLPEAARHGEAGCPACDLHPRLIVHTQATPLRTTEAAEAAIARFAASEGVTDVATFCEANLGGTIDEVVARLVAGQPVHSSLDVLAFLFPGSYGGGGGGGGAPAETSRVRVPSPVAPRPKPAPVQPTDPLQPAKLLASIATADGELRADERAFAEAMLRREGWPELSADGWRVYRPWETGPPPHPERALMLLEAAVQLSHLDHERDTSEWKVILAYANAWAVQPELLHELDKRWEHRHTTLFTQLISWLNRQIRLH